jgi:hypothetical protein
MHMFPRDAYNKKAELPVCFYTHFPRIGYVLPFFFDSPAGDFFLPILRKT